ncbi:MAG: hypothetical protein KatS3mg050_5015 [Litorilinea sp.]|nr:MAG: hypothetical protein KatS3mg050_5015 [Litorilinea sp.]
MTYSIVARDLDTGQLGVAVQTCNLAVGTWVPWAEGGVGAVATQALAERRYGTLGLALLRGGMTAPQALAALLAADPQRDFRQVSLVDRAGRVATHTGRRCMPEAGSHAGPGFCTQANMMARDTVWEAMAVAYQEARGDLAERLLAALDAAQAEGGDIRGQQTAALVVVDAAPNPFPLVDLRVDHHPRPVQELRRLLRLHRAYSAERAVACSTQEPGAPGEKAQVEAWLAEIATLAPGEGYLQFLRAMHLAGRLGREQEALTLLRELIQQDPMWREYLRREAQVDHCGYPGLGQRLLDALEP